MISENDNFFIQLVTIFQLRFLLCVMSLLLLVFYCHLFWKFFQCRCNSKLWFPLRLLPLSHIHHHSSHYPHFQVIYNFRSHFEEVNSFALYISFVTLFPMTTFLYPIKHLLHPLTSSQFSITILRDCKYHIIRKLWILRL